MTKNAKVGAAVGAVVVAAGLVAAVLLSAAGPLPLGAEFVTGPQTTIGATWFDTTEVTRGKVHGAQCTTLDITSNDYILLNYYDLPLTEYIAYERTGDTTFLTYARACADRWWQHPQWIGSGSIRKWPNEVAPPPRHAGVGGLIIRAMDGRPEMWDWLVEYTKFSLDLWLKRRVSDPALYYGLREGAFSLQYAAWLAKVLPDSYPLQAGGTGNGTQVRAQLLADIETVVVNYHGRLQQVDGSWRWDDPDYTDTDGGQLKGIMQPFMVGLLLQAEADVYQLTSNPAVKASITTQLTKACHNLYEGGAYRRLEPVPVDPTKRWRSFWYFYYGGTTVNPTKYATGGGSETGQELWQVKSERQSIALVVPVYYFAYSITGDLWYRNAGDELWDSAYGDTDGIRDEADGTAKNYNQNYRGAGSSLVWRGEVTPASPTVTPSGESANNTRVPPAEQVVDSTGAVWTRMANGTILRNGGATGGVGSIILYCNHLVYVFGTDSQWWKWSNGWVAVGATDPCGALTPTPTPVPQPSPTATITPLPTVTPTPQPSPSQQPCQPTSWPSSVQGRNSQMATQRAGGCYPVNMPNNNTMQYARP